MFAGIHVKHIHLSARKAMSALTPGNMCLLSDSPSVWRVGSRTKPIILGSFSSLSPESSQMLDLSKAKRRYLWRSKHWEIRESVSWDFHIAKHGCSDNIKNYQVILPTCSSLISSHLPHFSRLLKHSASDHKVNDTKKVSAVRNEETYSLYLVWKEKALWKCQKLIFFLHSLFQSCNFLTEKTTKHKKNPSKPKTETKPIKQKKLQKYLIEHLLKPVMNSRHFSHKHTQITQD